ncbi:MAG: hypothetical protein K0S26_845 [Bacteroidota bacterium]|jgi:hypothetical protein|nr:hypothetical protein [Bacteroidota bacterium]
MIKNQPVTLCGESVSGVKHICAFFDSKEEQYQILLPYYKEGLDNKEEVITILESKSHGEHFKQLSNAGIPVENVLKSGQLKVLASEDTYLKGGAFAAERMFNMLEEALLDAKNGRYNTVRTCGDMDWALKNLPGTDELMEYESRINLLTPKHECTLLCAYDINKISGKAVADILATHSHVIMNGKIHKNPHFVQPFEFLQQLLRRPKRLLGARATI